MQDLIIFPFNANGIEALDCLGDNYNLIGFVDDVKEKQGTSNTGHQVWAREAFSKYRNAKILAVPGGPATYLDKPANIDSLNFPKERFANVIHPSAQVSLFSKMGYNLLIMAGVVITPGALIGNHICILPNSVIHHDVVLNDFTWIGSGVVIAGNVHIKENAFIGSGSRLINNIEIGANTLIGIGSNVISSVAPDEKMAGNPAKSIKRSL